MTTQYHYLYSMVLYPSDYLCSECTRPSAFGYMYSSLFAMSSCLCARYSQLTVICLCLLAWVHLIYARCNVYLIPVFSVTPFSICELPGCVYWVVCLSFGIHSCVHSLSSSGLHHYNIIQTAELWVIQGCCLSIQQQPQQCNLLCIESKWKPSTP